MWFDLICFFCFQMTLKSLTMCVEFPLPDDTSTQKTYKSEYIDFIWPESYCFTFCVTSVIIGIYFSFCSDEAIWKLKWIFIHFLLRHRQHFSRWIRLIRRIDLTLSNVRATMNNVYDSKSLSSSLVRATFFEILHSICVWLIFNSNESYGTEVYVCLRWSFLCE